MKVLVVGGGIGGLTTALCLHAVGIECEVFEQAREIQELGVGINTLPHAIKELADLGLLDALDLVHGIREAQRRGKGHADRPLWPWARNTAWRHVKAVMAAADIPDGPHRSPKGLRHGFGVHAISSGVPLNMLSKWMGHASLEVTAIYADALGAEEQGIAARMWS